MKKELFSIIVPVYNAERYLEECILSIINQSYKELELILIDDGSIDESYKICKKFAERDERIRLIKNSNHGVSYTRNYGLKIAKGTYVTFVDSDDWLEPQSIEKFINIFDRYSVDIIQTNLLYCTKELKFKKFQNLEERLLQKNELDELRKNIISSYYMKYYHQDKFGPVRCIGGKAYRLSVLKDNNIHFNEEIYILEDGIFNLNVYEKSNKIYISNELLYNYRQNPNSTTFRYNPNQFEQSNVINNILYNYINKNYVNEPSYMMAFYLNCFESLSTYIYREQREKKYNYSNFKKNIINNILSNNYFYKDCINYIKYIYLTKKGKIILFLISNKLYFILYLLCNLKQILRR